MIIAGLSLFCLKSLSSFLVSSVYIISLNRCLEVTGADGVMSIAKTIVMIR